MNAQSVDIPRLTAKGAGCGYLKSTVRKINQKGIMEKEAYNQTYRLFECIGKLTLHETHTPDKTLKKIIKHDIAPHSIIINETTQEKK